jgi:hypothetical protein
MSGSESMQGRRNEISHQRGGALISRGYKVFAKNHDPSADPNPPTVLSGIRRQEYKKVQWVIRKPAGVTSYKASFYRLTGVVREAANASTEVIDLAWTLDETVSVPAEDLIYLQLVRGDEVVVVIHTIVGAIGTGFNIMHKGVQ